MFPLQRKRGQCNCYINHEIRFMLLNYRCYSVYFNKMIVMRSSFSLDKSNVYFTKYGMSIEISIFGLIGVTSLPDDRGRISVETLEIYSTLTQLIARERRLKIAFVHREYLRFCLV